MSMAALREADIPVQELSEEEAARAFGDAAEEDAAAGPPAADVGGPPAWAPALPPNLKIPEGVQLTWLRIRSALTIAPHKGDRVLVMWPLNEIEERQAVSRARGDSYQLVNELAKACIRVVDQVAADRTGAPGHPGNVAVLYRELGPKGRHLVRTYYSRTHTLSDEETTDFFSNCFATRIAEPG